MSKLRAASQMVDTLCNLSNPDDTAEDIRKWLAESVKTPLPLGGFPGNAVRRTVKLPKDLIAQIKEIGERATPPLSVGKTVGVLLNAWKLSRTGASPKSWLDGITRPEQRQVLDSVLPHLQRGRIVIAEAGTGIGKTRIALFAAAAIIEADRGAGITVEPIGAEDQLLKKGKLAATGEARALENEASRAASAKAVVIATPTVAVLNHLASEYLVTKDSVNAFNNIAVSVLLGRGQFISPMKLQIVALSLLEEITEPADIRSLHRLLKWIDAGMPCGQTKSTDALAAIMPLLRGLAEDARSLAPNFPIDDVLLADDDIDEEQMNYREAKIMALNSDLLFTTHSMLSVDNVALVQLKDSPPLLPQTFALIVDEAHGLEENQANACSTGCSLLTLRSMLKSMPQTALAHKLCSEAMDSLRMLPADVSLPIRGDGDVSVFNKWRAIIPPLVDLHVELAAVIERMSGGKPKKSKKAAKTPQIELLGPALSPADKKGLRVLKSTVYVLKTLLGGESNGAVTFSTVRRYPSITIGPSSVANYLAARWAVTDAALLLSGTLLVPTSEGASASMIVNKLAVPPERAVVTQPVHPPWLWSTPTLYLPSPDRFHELVPPNRNKASVETMKSWMYYVGVDVEHAASTAMGGTLVLMTGYERARLLCKALEARGLGERLVEQSRVQVPLNVARRRFIDLSEDGVRPIWVGVGGAWTGIDLLDKRFTDDEAEKDLLLTDLIMPALPFGMTRTTTQRSRESFMGFTAEKQVALMMFRQGFGRLVRRMNLLHRRLWVLDGRLAHPAMAALTREFNLLLASYEKRVYF